LKLNREEHYFVIIQYQKLKAEMLISPEKEI